MPHRHVGSGVWGIWDGGVMSWRATDLAEGDARQQASRPQRHIQPRTGNATQPIAEKSAHRTMWSQPNGLLHLAGKETEFIPGQRMIAEPYEMHGFRNDTAQPRNPQGHRYTRWRPGPYSAHAQWAQPPWLAGAR
jgi:hypothetical protein